MIAIPLAQGTKQCEKGVAALRWHDEIFEDDYDERRLKVMPKRTTEVVGEIFRRARTTGLCRLSAERIVKKFGMSYTTVNKIFAALVEEGWLIQVAYHNRFEGKATEYRLAVPARLYRKFVGLKLIDAAEAAVYFIKAKQDLPEDVEDVRDVDEDAREVDDGHVPEPPAPEEVPEPEEEVPHRSFPTPEELRALDEQEKLEEERAAKRYIRNEYGEYVTKPVEPDPMNMTEEEFDRWMDSRIGSAL